MGERPAGRDATARFRRDRQVLVVGSGLSAAASGGFLAQAGFDPVIAPAVESDGPSDAVVPLWLPGLAVLGRLGLRRPIERLATPLDALDCLGENEPRRAESGDRPALVAIDRDRLAALLDSRVFDRLRTVERPVTAIDHDASHVTATFADAVRERFDLAITATDTVLSGADDLDSQGRVHRWGVEWPGGVSAPTLPTEGWRERYAAVSTPARDRTAVELVAAGEFAEADLLERETLRDRFGSLLPGGDALFDALELATVSYRRTADRPRDTRVVDRTALVGPAVRPAGLANPLTAALAVEDAWVVADALAYGPESVPAALDAYQHRRRHRDGLIDASVPPGRCGRPLDRWPALDRLADARALGFGHLVGDDPPALARVGPADL